MRLALLGILSSGCIIPFATPPIKGDFGASTVTQREDGPNESSFHAAAGVHLASGVKNEEQKFDIGAGWTFEKTRESYSNGAYGDFAFFIDRAGKRRTSVGTRGEMRWLEDGNRALAAKLRVELEAFGGLDSPFAEDTKCGAMGGRYHGTAGISFYAEAGRLWAPMTSGGDGWVASVGVSLRIPSSYGVWFGIPGC